jgi:hypothetical protein
VETGKLIKKFTQEGNLKLDKQYSGTREAILQISREKVQEYIRKGDIGLGKEERELLVLVIAGSMMQSFSLGYGIGKVEGLTDKSIYL